MIAIDIKTNAEWGQVRTRIRDRSRRAQNMAPILKKTTPLLKEYQERAFTTGGRSTGPAWARLAATTRKWKVRHFPGAMILVATGALRRSFKIIATSRSTLRFGSSLRYAIFHQEGTARMPARPVIRITKKFEQELTTVIAQDFRWDRR